VPTHGTESVTGTGTETETGIGTVNGSWNWQWDAWLPARTHKLAELLAPKLSELGKVFAITGQSV